MERKKQKASRVARRIQEVDNYSKQWRLHQNIGQFATGLDRLPDAAAVRRDRQRSAPRHMVDMVF